LKNYILATNRDWILNSFLSKRNTLDGNWTICVSPQDLKDAASKTIPRYVFFPHWSHIVSQELLHQHECVCFHMTDVPYGRGGSPLQNLIARGHQETVLTALKMTAEIDAGPVYMKRPLNLEGTAQDIFKRAAELSMDMMGEIIAREPKSVPQAGTPVFFKRRKPEQSKLPEQGTLQEVFDHIRMLDAPGYPHAYFKYGDWTGKITKATLGDNAIEAHIRLEKSCCENK
jgi:methionyl-tRNA formyltransferase